MLGNNAKDKGRDVTLESNTVVSNLDAANGVNSTLTIINKGTVDPIAAKTLYNADYKSIKQQFGIRGDFCIYIIDQYGNIISVDTPGGQRTGFGDGNFSINGKPCGSVIS